jgi:DNA repair photolyase
MKRKHEDEGNTHGSGSGRVMPVSGRGTMTNVANRFANVRSVPEDDGWWHDDVSSARIETRWIADPARTVISHNDSPDVPFDRSINPYRGCEHGCIYCYARPSHAWLDLSPGIDFETRILFKPRAAELLDKALRARGYRCRPIGLGSNTDPWQPAERKLRISRSILTVLDAFNHPVTIVTKAAAIERDIDILASMALRNLVCVNISVTSLDGGLIRKLEPRSATPARRLKTISRLADAGIPVGVIVAPVIPFLNDAELEAILGASRQAGATFAHWGLIRLPGEVADLFRGWLEDHFPLKAEHVMSRIHQMRDGDPNGSQFGTRMRGTGVFAELMAQRFRAASRKWGFQDPPALDCNAFQPPACERQLTLF